MTIVVDIWSACSIKLKLGKEAVVSEDEDEKVMLRPERVACFFVGGRETGGG